ERQKKAIHLANQLLESLQKQVSLL
ncbi:membrane fusogenic activity, partial [Acinetobacter baumannii]|nr:membrane fusogenic activity [Acinetobacter baumannii]